MPLEIKDDELYHVGMPHYGVISRSGRYEWGSGNNPYQRIGDGNLLRAIELYKKDYPDATDKDICADFGFGAREYKARLANAKYQIKQQQYDRIKKMRDEEHMSFQAIAEELGYDNESSVRSMYKRSEDYYKMPGQNTADLIKDLVDKSGGYVDIGKGVEQYLGVSESMMQKARAILEDEGYVVLGRSVENMTNKGNRTTLMLVCPPGTTQKDLYNEGFGSKYTSIDDFHSEDHGKTFKQPEYPASISSKRIAVNYGDQTGKDLDGTVFIRRGVPDLDLGGSKYAQVRILVDGTHYIKGVAMYGENDEFPAGKDIIFNTNKKTGTPITSVLKEIKHDDPNNPFGALIKPIDKGGQSHYIDPKDGKEKLSAINKTREENDWNQWGKKLPSQFLGKQSQELINSQLNLKLSDMRAEYRDIQKLTNPVVKKAMLIAFANKCDATATDLDAAALPRQRYQVLLPVPSLKDGEIYAPNYNHGETVALIRFPHAGTFETVVGVVNNKNKEALKRLGQAADAVGVNAKAAEKLSGADFDGDTVMVIPCNRTANGGISKVQIKSRPQLRDLDGFDPHTEYAGHEGTRILKKSRIQNEMGQISNLITDMTIKGAPDNEMARAVKHSMVIIDAYKHKLDYKKSEKENGIKELKDKYQGKYNEEGRWVHPAATILSRAKGQISVPKRVGSPRIDPETGKVIYKTDGTEYEVYDKNKGQYTGKKKTRTQQSKQMMEVDDAFDLVSDKHNPVEVAYANYANALKAMGNEARKEFISTKGMVYSSKAAKTYEKEVRSITDKIAASEKNKPRERKAQVLANIEYQQIVADNPHLSKEEQGKYRQLTLSYARTKTGSHREKPDVTDREWEAIQAGAVSSETLRKLINYAGIDTFAERSMPKSQGRALPEASQDRIKRLFAAGTYSAAEIAADIGCSVSTVWKYVNE